MSYDLKSDDIWINEDFSNDYPEFRDKTKHVYTAQLPWLGTKEEAESLKQQIIAEHEFYINCNKKYPNLANYTIGLLKNQRTDQDKENEKKSERLQQFLEYLFKLSTDGNLTDQGQGILVTLENWVKLGEERFNPYLRSDKL